MTGNKSFKRRVRARMTKTGESYTAARARVVEKRERNRTEPEAPAESGGLPSDDSVRAATGRSWGEWFDILDAWGAKEKSHTEIARHVADVDGVSGWWAQSVTVGYERARGMRQKHQNSRGFSISASKTIAVPVQVLFDAVVNESTRKSWMPDASMSLRIARPARTARFDWEDGTTRVVAGFTAKGDSRSMIAIAHEKLPDARAAEAMKSMWRERLGELKDLLEGSHPSGNSSS